jgi:serine/threonine protein kinase/Tol biopolymer transport system component
MPAIGEYFLRYKILSLIGSGGMGEVYLARDQQLNRNVAVKVLKPKLSHRHPDALERFILEARSASALNHPNIITIYEIGETEGSHYIASEYIEGETLHERINRRSLSLPDILNIAVQTAEALAAAHAAGIVHRDIKPENIMVREDGYIKVLDFGLAKLSEFEMQMADVEADTRRMVATNPGVVMGTVSYMSPEQARGLTVDKRSDIWSLGVVIHEMLTGKRPFRGETTSDVIAAILKSEPEPISMRASQLDRILARALEKDRDERYQDIKDLLIDLRNVRRDLDTEMRSNTVSFAVTNGESPVMPTGDDNFAALSTSPGQAHTHSISEIVLDQFRLHPVLLTLIIAVAAIGLIAAAWTVIRSLPGTTGGFGSMRFVKLTSSGKVEGGQIAVSPDGKNFAYAARDADGQSLWVQQTATSSGIQLLPPSAVSFAGVTFSPDSNYIYYSAAELGALPAVYKVPALGGETRRLITDAAGPISFSPKGERFVFIRGGSELVTANADGNEQQPLANLSGGETWKNPVWSPDGKRIAAGVFSPKDSVNRLVEVSPENGKVTDLRSAAWLRLSGLAWLPDGSGLLISGRDPETQFLQVWNMSYPDGALTRITNDAQSYEGLGTTGNGGSLVTVQVSRTANIWVGSERDPASAKQITSQTGRDEGLSGVAWTPEGELMYTTRLTAFQDLWSVNRDGSDNRQVTFNSKQNFWPAVSPDGRYTIFISTRSGNAEIWRSNRDGSEPVQLTFDPGIESLPVISADSRTVIYELEDGDNTVSIWRVNIDGGAPEMLVGAGASRPALSPDGRSLAYRWHPGNSGGLSQLAIRNMADGTTLLLDLPTATSGRYFRWSSDGRSVLYTDLVAGSSRLYSQPAAGGEPKIAAEFKDKRIYVFDVSPRGAGIALSLGSEMSEGLMISNFR